MLKRHITDEANARLAFYLPIPSDQLPPTGIDLPQRPRLPDGVVDTPLVRLYNFLRTFDWPRSGSNSDVRRNHVLILSAGDPMVPGRHACFVSRRNIDACQAQRMRSLGWADYMKVEMTNNRKTLTASYWM
jgi:mediator of RNA polymerase II transcription subunit 14